MLSNSRIILPAGYQNNKSNSKIVLPAGYGGNKSTTKLTISSNTALRSRANSAAGTGGNTAVIEVPKVFAADKQEAWVYHEARKQAAKGNEGDEFKYLENAVYTKRFFNQVTTHLGEAFLAIEEAQAANKARGGGAASDRDYQKALDELLVVNEGIVSTWRLINEERNFPALSLFNTEEGNYGNVPTDDVVLRHLDQSPVVSPSSKIQNSAPNSPVLNRLNQGGGQGQGDVEMSVSAAANPKATADNNI